MQERNPGFYVGEAGSASTGKALERAVGVAARAGGAPLDPAHARHPAARLRLARGRVDPTPPRAHVRVRDDGARRPAEPDRPDGSGDLGGDPAHRARRRRRLLALLHPPRARRAAGGAQRVGGPRGRSGDVRPRRPHGGDHGHDRHGRDVLLRRQDVHVVRDRDDDGRRRRDDRLADRPARPCSRGSATASTRRACR